jgi:predicted transposase/invertase (TIGR01784 family)
MRFLRETESLDNIPEEFQNTPELARAMELAQECAYTPEELDAYDEYLDAIRVEGAIRADSFEEGREEGREEGEQKKALMIAKAMMAEGSTLDFIQRMTQLPMPTIEEIKRNQITG